MISMLKIPKDVSLETLSEKVDKVNKSATLCKMLTTFALGVLKKIFNCVLSHPLSKARPGQTLRHAACALWHAVNQYISYLELENFIHTQSQKLAK